VVEQLPKKFWTTEPKTDSDELSLGRNYLLALLSLEKISKPEILHLQPETYYKDFLGIQVEKKAKASGLQQQLNQILVQILHPLMIFARRRNPVPSQYLEQHRCRLVAPVAVAALAARRPRPRPKANPTKKRKARRPLSGVQPCSLTV